jgi:hypothetical protein
LHPSIKERLARVRELALAGVANLHGVVRDAPANPADANVVPGAGGPRPAWLVWEHVPGRTLAEYAATPLHRRKLAVVARELVLLVAALHRQGIVHGAIRASNVIVDGRDNVRLTHVSPLLYSDPADDLWGVVHAIKEAVAARGEQAPPLGRRSRRPTRRPNRRRRLRPGPRTAMRSLAGRLGGVIDGRDPVDAPAEADGDEPAAAAPRRRSLLGAAVVVLLGAAVAGAAWRLVRFPDNPLPGWVQSARDGWR